MRRPTDRIHQFVRVLTSQSYPASAALASRGGWRLLMLSESLTSLRTTSTGGESDFIAIQIDSARAAPR